MGKEGWLKMNGAMESMRNLSKSLGQICNKSKVWILSNLLYLPALIQDMS